MDDITGKLFLYGAKKKISNFLDDDSEKNDDVFSSVKKTLGFEDEEKKKPQEEGMFSDFKKKLGLSQEEETRDRSKSTPPPKQEEGSFSGVKKTLGIGESSQPPPRHSKARSEERERIAKKYGLSQKTEDHQEPTKASATSSTSRPHSTSFSEKSKPVSSSTTTPTPSTSEQPGFFSKLFGFKGSNAAPPQTEQPIDDSPQDFGSLIILETEFPDVDEAILKKVLRENGGDVEKSKQALLNKGYKCVVLSKESTVSAKSLNALKKQFPDVDEDILKSTLEEFNDDPKQASEYLKTNKIPSKKKGWFG